MELTQLRLNLDEATHGCGIGQEARCCKFLLHDLHGFICGRHSELHEQIVAAKMHAGRMPVEVYPECQLQPQ
jgi:hypothetical protein